MVTANGLERQPITFVSGPSATSDIEQLTGKLDALQGGFGAVSQFKIFHCVVDERLL